MSTDGNFRPISPAALQKLIDDPDVADLVMSFYPPYDKRTDTFYWPETVRRLWDTLVASGGEDLSAARELRAELKHGKFFFHLEADDLADIAAAGFVLDEIPAGVDYCGAKWPDMHLLITGTSPVPPGEMWSPKVPLSPLLGVRRVGDDMGYEGGRVLSVEETAAAADALAAVSDDEMRARYEAFARKPDGTLPKEWEEMCDGLVELFARVRTLYAEARDRGQAMFVYLE